MNTTASNTLDCDKYQSLEELLQESPNKNLTELMSSCQNACNLLFGSGNPDLAGIGVSASLCLD